MTLVEIAMNRVSVEFGSDWSTKGEGWIKFVEILKTPEWVNRGVVLVYRTPLGVLSQFVFRDDNSWLILIAPDDVDQFGSSFVGVGLDDSYYAIEDTSKDESVSSAVREICRTIVEDMKNQNQGLNQILVAKFDQPGITPRKLDS